MNRPSLILRALALGAVATLVAACGSSGSGSTTDSTSKATATETSAWVTSTPAASGKLAKVTWDLPFGEPSSLDPAQAAAYSANTVLANLCEGLLREGSNFQLEPSLASSYSNPTPTTWVYRLRPNVKFTDGHPMTVADVIYSLERNQSAKVGSFWSQWYANVKSITALGANAIKVTLKQPDAMFNQFMATAAGVVGEKAYIEKVGSTYGTAKGKVMCTGPYSLEKWTPGSDILTVANPHYWDKALTPKVAEIDYKFITNPNTLADALETGAIDGSYEVPIAAVNKLQDSGEGKLYLGKSTQFASLEFTGRPGPDQDIRVREALTIAIDRAAIAKTVFGGTAVPISSMAFPATWGYAQSVYRRAYAQMPDLSQPNLAKAKQLLTSVGKIRTLKVMVDADDWASTQMGVYLQSLGSQLGINLQIVSLPAAQYIASAFDPKQTDAYDLVVSTSGYFDVPEPLEMGIFMLTPGQSFNTAGYNNPAVTKLLTEAQSTTNPSQRATMVASAFATAEGKDWDLDPLVNFSERLFMNKRVSGADPAIPSFLYYPWGAELGGTS